MKRLALALAVVALGSCQQKTGVVPGKLLGTHDIAQVDRYLFIASTDNNELRVLDLLDPQAQNRNFVRAPNPLESLSVPVLDRATEVYADLAYGADGFPSTGKLVYATRSGAREISVVDASHPLGDADAGTVNSVSAKSSDVRFREILRLPLPGPLTALATWHAGDTSRLYVATWDGTTTTIWAIDLPASPAEVRALDLARPWKSMTALTTLDRETVPALLTVPGLSGRTKEGTAFCAGAEECLVIASRASAGKGGRTVLFEPSTRQSATLSFPQPVRLLVTHGADAPPPDQGYLPPLSAGERVFGLLDEEACGSLACGGALAIDTRHAGPDGFPVANDASGQPMLPLSSGSGLIQGLTLGTRLNASPEQANVPSLQIPGSIGSKGAAENRLYPVLGILTASNGDILFFDGKTLEHIDVDPAGPAVTEESFNAPVDSDGGVLTFQRGPLLNPEEADGGLILGDGSWRSQQIVVVWEGVVAGLAAVPTSAADGTHLRLPPGTTDRVRVDDPVIFSTASRICGETTISAVGDGAIDVLAIPSGCDERVAYAVRGGPAAPLVVTATLLGYLGRASPGGTLVVASSPFVHLAGFTPATPTLQLSFGPYGKSAGATRGMFWTLQVDGHFAPYVSIVDTASSTNGVVCTGAATLPSTPLFDAAHNLLFVVYPSGNGVVEINPQKISRGAIGNGNSTTCWH